MVAQKKKTCFSLDMHAYACGSDEFIAHNYVYSEIFYRKRKIQNVVKMANFPLNLQFVSMHMHTVAMF